MELWDILDKSGTKTGKLIKRGDPIEKGEYHLIVNVWIKNSNGDFLISKRSPYKTLLPNMWETTCGAVVINENSLSAALREVKEELGIDLSPANAEYLFRTRRDHIKFPDFTDVWLFTEDVNINDVILQQNEVSSVKWSSPDEIYDMIKFGEFTDTFKYINNLFKIKA